MATLDIVGDRQFEPDEPTTTTPPEVPEEFAAAYRAAYERAMADQSLRPHRTQPSGDDADELPRRSGRLRTGTHRTPPGREPAVPPPPRHRSAQFVALLLLLLALVLILGAYAVGRVFAGSVG